MGRKKEFRNRSTEIWKTHFYPSGRMISIERVDLQKNGAGTFGYPHAKA